MRPRHSVPKTDYPIRIVILSERSESKDLSSPAASLVSVHPLRSSRVPYTLPSSVCSKSFACRSYENCRVYPYTSHFGSLPQFPHFFPKQLGWGFSPLATRHSPLATISCRINICGPLATAHSKRLTQMLSPLEATFTKNRGVGGQLWLTRPRKLRCPGRPS
jgi:hypothetical protein